MKNYEQNLNHWNAMAQNCQVDSMTRNLELCGNLGVSLGDCVKMLAEGLGQFSD